MERMSVIHALNTAVRRLQNTRSPTVAAARVTLARLRDELREQVEADKAARIQSFLSKSRLATEAHAQTGSFAIVTDVS